MNFIGMEEMSEDYDEEDDEELAEYSPKSDFSKAKVVEDAIRKCIEARGKEMKAGYYNTKLTKEGDPIRMWVEDSRQIFIGTVIALRTLLFPEIKTDTTCKESLKKIDEKKKQILDKYSYKEKSLERDTKTRRMIWKENGNKIMPEIDAVVVAFNPMNPQVAKEIRGGWNLYTNAYWNDLVDIYDRTFATLNNLIGSDSINYFKTKSSF